MRYSQVIDLLAESGLSPDGIAERLSLSSSTFQRWMRLLQEIPCLRFTAST